MFLVQPICSILRTGATVLVAVVVGCISDPLIHHADARAEIVIMLEPGTANKIKLSLDADGEFYGGGLGAVCFLYVAFPADSPVREVELHASAPGFDESLVFVATKTDMFIDYSDLVPQVPTMVALDIEVLLRDGGAGEVTVSADASVPSLESEVELSLVLEEIGG